MESSTFPFALDYPNNLEFYFLVHAVHGVLDEDWHLLFHDRKANDTLRLVE